MTTLERREAHLNELRTQVNVMPAEELRQRIRGTVSAQFIMAEMRDETQTTGQIGRLMTLLGEFSAMEESHLRESSEGAIAVYDTLRAETLAHRSSDPMVGAITLLSGLLDDMCAAAQMALDDDESWQAALAAQVTRWIRTPPLGV